MLRSAIKWTVIYLLLVVGSAFCSIPFLWMATTSVKVDRELFTKDLRLLPLTPRPAVQSPYVDSTYFQYVNGPHQDELLRDLRSLAQASGFAPPGDVPAEAAWNEIAVGLYERLSRTLPAQVWKGTVADILAAAQREVTDDAVAEVFAIVHRRVLLGQIRVRSRQFEEAELGADRPFDQRFRTETPRQARVINWTDS